MRRPSPRGAPGNIAVALLMIGLGATVTGVQCSRNDALQSSPSLWNPSPPAPPRVPSRASVQVEQGPEVLVPRLEGIVTAVYVKPGDALADGKPILAG